MSAPARGRWERVGEVGSDWALRHGAALMQRLGPRGRGALLWCASLYFALRNGPTRRGSLQYLEHVHALPEGARVLGAAPGLALVLRHFQHFGSSIYDRILLWGGALDRMQIRKDRTQEFFRLAEQGRGALLLGAHIGSIDMLWFLSREYDLVVNVVVFFQNAERINTFFQSRSPGTKLRAIELDPASVRAAFQIKACLERGEFVVMLADRLPPGRAARSAKVPFLGEAARFPLTPFLIAAVLGSPVLLTVCLREGPERYDSVLRVLHEGGRIARSERDAWAHELLATYVREIEAICLAHPLQWFNFFEFWEGADA